MQRNDEITYKTTLKLYLYYYSNLSKYHYNKVSLVVIYNKTDFFYLGNMRPVRRQFKAVSGFTVIER